RLRVSRETAEARRDRATKHADLRHRVDRLFEDVALVFALFRILPNDRINLPDLLEKFREIPSHSPLVHEYLTVFINRLRRRGLSTSDSHGPRGCLSGRRASTNKLLK